MDDNYIVNRILDILENSNQNLLLGNINSPRPGSICQVSTDYGIKDAYNINCTYPGDAYVIWDNDEEQYYCFTDKPSEVISSRQLSYRKYQQVKKKTNGGGYILLFDSNFDLYQNENQRINTNTYLFFEQILTKLNPNNKHIYYALPKSNSTFLNLYSYSNIVDQYPNIVTYLKTKNFKFVPIKDTELNKINGIFWMPFYKDTITETKIQLAPYIDKFKQIANTYGLILQSEWAGASNLQQYYLDTFYNPYNTPKITSYVNINYTGMYSNLDSNNPVSIDSSASAGVDIKLLKNKNVLAYFRELDKSYYEGGIPINDTKYASIIYW